tara:strand:+ start:409 stop:636 length:228 start_codon:yes stop_codon:yes gene_type:complete
MKVGPLIIYGGYMAGKMTVKEAVQNVLKMYMPDERKHFEEASAMALQHNSEVVDNHIYYSLIELDVALHMGEFDD